MFCVQESEDPLAGDPFATAEKDPFGGITVNLSESSDEEPPAKRPHMSFDPSLNLTVYQIPAFNQDTCKANPYSKPMIKPVELTKLINKRYSAPEPVVSERKDLKGPYFEKYPVRYKKNGEVAKKRGPPVGYKRKPKIEPLTQEILDLHPSLTITPTGNFMQSRPNVNPTNCGRDGSVTPSGTLVQMPNVKGLSITPVSAPSVPQNKCNNPAAFGVDASANPLAAFSQMLSNLSPAQRNNILSGILSNAMEMAKNVDVHELMRHLGVAPAGAPGNFTILPQPAAPAAPRTHKIVVPKGAEHIELELDPEDWFPTEPYQMTFFRRKNAKWKNYPYQCEYCFKGYRIVSSLLAHAAERHGTVPRQLALPCPCCPHVSVRKKQHRKHVEQHSVRRGKLYCQYCVPAQDPSEEYKPVSERFPYDKYSQFYYASEESLRLHRKRKHPYAAMFNSDWFCTWGDGS